MAKGQWSSVNGMSGRNLFAVTELTVSETRCKGSFTPSGSVTVTVTLMGGPFDLFDGTPFLPVNATFMTESLGVNETEVNSLVRDIYV